MSIQIHNSSKTYKIKFLEEKCYRNLHSLGFGDEFYINYQNKSTWKIWHVKIAEIKFTNQRMREILLKYIWLETFSQNIQTTFKFTDYKMKN